VTGQSTDPTVRKTITVEVPAERAFTVFTEQMGSWWPLEDKSIGSAPAATVVVEPRAGGRWYERGVDGSESDWGHVLAYEPPSRLLLGWQISADWKHDATLHTEVEVRFVAEGDHRTRVELEHRGLEAYGERSGQMQAIFDSPDGWRGILDAFSAKTTSPPPGG